MSEKKIDYLKTVFGHNQQLIQLADSKANIIISVICVILPIIFGVDIYVAFEEFEIGLKIFLFVTFIVAVSLFSISFSYAANVIRARIDENFDEMIFFASINKIKLDEYKKFIENLDETKILEEYMKENYAIARINSLKYKNYNRSLLILMISILFLVLRYLIFFGIIITV